MDFSFVCFSFLLRNLIKNKRKVWKQRKRDSILKTIRTARINNDADGGSVKSVSCGSLYLHCSSETNRTNRSPAVSWHPSVWFSETSFSGQTDNFSKICRFCNLMKVSFGQSDDVWNHVCAGSIKTLTEFKDKILFSEFWWIFCFFLRFKPENFNRSS